ncbi:ABC transporter substrate-binding protein [Pararhodobacter zhoushanensis]|uniref:ABC transporter substrate-binding protein n=1 Tax=Pararhodobacter zhoushanensis TaxID=2479545 RepID=A0ABT3GZX8_9RHOB|nr:ABC transporter substrate-binding protein [Pararhodobacter zhoushanensis]MCW1933055.1 ABC transporter substrate-binding protein [Pararhodobacter zhoushanensis]
MFTKLRTVVTGLAVAAALTTPVLAQTTAPRIAIALFGPHPSLQQVSDGFKASLDAAGYEPVYDEGNVNFDRSLVPQFLNRLAAADPDLMLTITTPMAQSARQILANRDFPIVFAPVTDPVQAGLVGSWDAGAPLLTGVSNIPDLAATVAFMQSLVPGMTRLGVLYNPGDDSDTAFATRLQTLAPAQGVEVLLIGVDNANDIPQRVTSAQGRVDALFVPASSLLQPASPAIASAAGRISMPVFSSNTQSVGDALALATFAVDFYRIGERAGDLAARILGGEDPATIAIAVPAPEDHLIRISQRQMTALGLTLPEALTGCDCVVD